jgi:hypothetical protein
MNVKMNANGRERKTLASQIDRLDVMLDGLADGLNEAVAQAVQNAVGIAVQEAIQAVLTEIFTNPAVMAKVRAAAEAAQPEQADDEPVNNGPGRLASWRDWVSTKVKKVGERCKAGWKRVSDAGVAVVRRAACMVKTAATAVRKKTTRVMAMGWLFGNLLLRLAVAFGSGVAARVAIFFTGFVLTWSPGDLRALLLTTVARCVVWLRRLVGTLARWATRRPAWQLA